MKNKIELKFICNISYCSCLGIKILVNGNVIYVSSKMWKYITGVSGVEYKRIANERESE